MGVVKMPWSGKPQDEEAAQAMLRTLDLYDFLAQMDRKTKIGWCRFAVMHNMNAMQFARLVWYLGVRQVDTITDDNGILIDAMTGAPMTSEYEDYDLPF